MTTDSPQPQDEELFNIIITLCKDESQWNKVKELLLAWRRTTSLDKVPENQEEDDMNGDYLTGYTNGWNEAIDLTKKNMESI